MILSDTTFTPGDVVIATMNYGHNVTKDKEYTVTDFAPEAVNGAFTWPAYVTVLGDDSRPATAHTYRFRKKEY